MMLQIFKLMMHIFEGNIKFQKLQNLSLRNHNLNDLQSCPKPTNEHFSLIIYYKKKMIRSNYVIYFIPIITMKTNDNLIIFNSESTFIRFPFDTRFKLISLVFLGCRPIMDLGSPLQPSTEHRQA